MTGFAESLLALDGRIRYVAVNQNGAIAEMLQRLPSFNPPETDRMEELVVNPVALELFARRGNLDLGGLRFVIVRYGLQFQVILPCASGHVSIGVEADGDPVAIAERVASALLPGGRPKPQPNATSATFESPPP
jgi:hypothetical protein